MIRQFCTPFRRYTCDLWGVLCKCKQTFEKLSDRPAPQGKMKMSTCYQFEGVNEILGRFVFMYSYEFMRLFMEHSDHRKKIIEM